MAARHRLQQGVRALVAFARPIEYALAGQYLNEAQMTLFRRMKRSERLHSLNVLRQVMAQPCASHDLAVAALLHDCGKVLYPLAIWQKSVAVIFRRITPTHYHRWSEKSASHWWYRAFVVAEKHPQWGAQLVAETGASAKTVWLIANHAQKECILHAYGNALKVLQSADDVN